MRTAKRVTVIWVLAFIVVLVWVAISKTSWATTVDSITAGKSYTHWIEPFRELAGALLVSVPAVLLIRSGWDHFARTVLGREPRPRVKVDRGTRAGRSSDDRPAREFARTG
jgi:hypothetical protein